LINENLGESDIVYITALQIFQVVWASEKFQEILNFFMTFKFEKIFFPLKPSKFVGSVAQIDGCGAGSAPSGGAKGSPPGT
jgi:hypothetical protein